MFSARTMTVALTMDYLPALPLDLALEYLPKWSGGCFEDYSSGVGGFCLLEDSDIKTGSACTNKVAGVDVPFSSGSAACIWDATTDPTKFPYLL